MKHYLISVASIVLVFSSCSKEKCITCIAESSEGKIAETRMACDKSDSFFEGFADGFEQKHKENDKNTTVHCAYSE